MGDPLAQFTMLGSGFNSQLVPNPNAAGSSQQQQPSDSMQPIGGLPNPEHSRMWMQIQQQINQQRTASGGDIVGSQVTLNPPFVPSLSFFHFSPPPFLPPTHFPPSRCHFAPVFVLFSSPGIAPQPTLTFSVLGLAYVSSGFCYVLTLPFPSPTVLWIPS